MHSKEKLHEFSPATLVFYTNCQFPGFAVCCSNNFFVPDYNTAFTYRPHFEPLINKDFKMHEGNI